MNQSERPTVRERVRHRTFLLWFFVVLLVASVGLYSFVKSDVPQKETRLQELREELRQIESENKEIEDLIDSNDVAQMYEHLARKSGYVYPDEKIFYNVTPGSGGQK